MNDFLIIAFATIAVLAIECLYIKIARRLLIVDRPNERSSHNVPTIRGGGVIFPLGVLIVCALHGFAHPWFMAGLLTVAAVSFIDDLCKVDFRLRLIAHLASAAMLLLSIDAPGGIPLWMWPLGLLLCAGVVNAYNFMDGINGITAMYSISVLVPLAVLNFTMGFIEMDVLWISIASLLIFGFYNCRERAVCFAGDVGSIGVAYITLFAVGLLIVKTGDFCWLLLMAVYGCDASLTLLHRLCRGENIAQAHRMHLYQILSNELGLDHMVVSTLYALLQLCVSLGLLAIRERRWLYCAIACGALAVCYVCLMAIFFKRHKPAAKSKLSPETYQRKLPSEPSHGIYIKDGKKIVK